MKKINLKNRMTYLMSLSAAMNLKVFETWVKSQKIIGKAFRKGKLGKFIHTPGYPPARISDNLLHTFDKLEEKCKQKRLEIHELQNALRKKNEAMNPPAAPSANKAQRPPSKQM